MLVLWCAILHNASPSSFADRDACGCRGFIQAQLRYMLFLPCWMTGHSSRRKYCIYAAENTRFADGIANVPRLRQRHWRSLQQALQNGTTLIESLLASYMLHSVQMNLPNGHQCSVGRRACLCACLCASLCSCCDHLDCSRWNAPLVRLLCPCKVGSQQDGLSSRSLDPTTGSN